MIGMTLFYWITGNLTTICSYLVVRKKGIAFQPMEIIREATTYLKRALRFDGYYYSILSVILFVLFLLCLPFLRGMI